MLLNSSRLKGSDGDDRGGCRCRSVEGQILRSRMVATNANSSDTKITVKAERYGSLETAQGFTEKADGHQGNGGEICVESGRDRTEARDSARGGL